MKNLVQVEFHGDTIWAIERGDEVLVAIKPICESMGMQWEAQLKRIKRDEILTQGMSIMDIPSPGGAQETMCLPLNLIPGWLFGVDDRRITDENVRQKVLTYKRECYAVLYSHFFNGRSGGQKVFEHAGTPDQDEPLLTRRSLVTEARQSFGVQASRELWFKLNMPIVPAMYADPAQGEFFYTAIKRDKPEEQAAA